MQPLSIGDHRHHAGVLDDVPNIGGLKAWENRNNDRVGKQDTENDRYLIHRLSIQMRIRSPGWMPIRAAFRRGQRFAVELRKRDRARL